MGTSRVFLLNKTLLVLLVLLALAGPVSAQVLYGSLVGTVVDQSGGAVPNAVVTISDKQTGQSRSDKTGSGRAVRVPQRATGHL